MKNHSSKTLVSLALIAGAVVVGYFLLRTQNVQPSERTYSSLPFTLDEGKFSTSLFSFDTSSLPPGIGLLEMEQSNSIICKHYFDAIFVNQIDREDYTSEIDVMGRSMRCNPMPMDAMTVTQKSMRDRLMAEYGYSALEAESVVAWIPTWPEYAKMLPEGGVDQISLYFRSMCAQNILDTNHTGALYIANMDCTMGDNFETNLYTFPSKERNAIVTFWFYTDHLSEQASAIVESFTWK